MVAAHRSNVATKSTIAALEHASAVAEMRRSCHPVAADVTVVVVETEPTVAMLVEATPVVRAASSAKPIDSSTQKPSRKKTKPKPTKKKPKPVGAKAASERQDCFRTAIEGAAKVLELQMEAFEEEELQGFLVANGLKPGGALPSAGFAIDAAAYMDHISISLFSNNLAADLKKYCRPPGTFHVTTMEHNYVDPISGERMCMQHTTCVHAKHNDKSLAFRYYDPEARNKWRPLTKNTFKAGTQLRWIRRVIPLRDRTTDDE
ncbi:hypothetical protein SPRG_15003 [Saprolegnia parasitica CBS 223.65]|uniref:Uncharacterized protein n=1 Tax=Saprolegnia parasitica (strain CBS 223.65) TaxID=695850 RepID=A0A067BKP8_SAPPC|nr:hypothetical protein SPRG_15003 [Saprolegnia parasitica CBS 223.65]KDO19049.1 hypothetical protein SPRG_15003 [Saprolegnia parasitica CBS 223.65]|eukprot:XP_012210237.1 hypothetical protein SPRG_15003 [Saprolegnia parasitica CBS 223.65]